MRIIWSLIWSFLLSSMLVYVISNMGGISFNLTAAIVLGIAFTVVVAILGDGISEDEA